MVFLQLLGDFVVVSVGLYLELVIVGYGVGVQILFWQWMCWVFNIDIGGGILNYVLFDVGNVSVIVCFNVGGCLLEIDVQGCVVYVYLLGQWIVDVLFGVGINVQVLIVGQLVQVVCWMVVLIVEVIEGIFLLLVQGLM